MPASTAEINQILNRMRVPGEETLFVLGSFERPATLYMQQVRALNLIFALSRTRVSDDCALAVIGAGAGGLTAAAAAAMLGWRVTLLDRITNDVLSLAGSITSQRWLHPHIYDWPAPGKDRADAGLCLLNWTAGPADRVITSLREGWKRIESNYGIATYLGATEISLDKADGKHLVQWNGARSIPSEPSIPNWDARPAKRFCAKLFDIVVLAVGFGREEPTTKFPMVFSYWEPDKIDQNREGKKGFDTVLVSGNGDGGLIDILRLSFKGFRHDTVLEDLRNKWLGEQRFKQVQEQLQSIEEQAHLDRAQGRPYAAQLNVAYRTICDSLELNMPIPIRQDLIPVLTGTSKLPLTLDSAPLNRFLFSLTNAQYRPGPVVRAKKLNGSYSVWFGGRSEPESYDELVIRHGPTSALKRWFPEIHERCAGIAKAARESPDPSREAKYDEVFEDLLRRASRSLETPRQPASPAAIQQAVSLARPEIGTTAANKLYLEALCDRLQWLDQAHDLRLDAAFVPLEIAPIGGEDRAVRGPEAREPDLLRRSVVGIAWLASGPPFRVIAGAPGTGKTTLLRFLAWQAAQDHSYFPVFVPLRTIDFDREGPLLLRALDWCLSWLEAADADYVQEVRSLYARRLLQGRAVVILDGFDELATAKQARLLELVREGERADFGSNKILLSTRRIDPITSISKALFYEIMPLSAQQTRELIDRLVPDRDAAEQVVSLLASVPSVGIAAHPVRWFGLMARFISARKPRLGGVLELVADFVEYGLQGISGTRMPMVRSALGRLAYQKLWSGGFFSRRDLEEILMQSVSPAESQSVVEALITSPLLIAQNNEAQTDTYVYSHRLVQEYLAAREVAQGSDPMMAIASMGFDPQFSNSDLPAMVVGLIDDPDSAIAALETLPDSLDHTILRLRARAMRFTEHAQHEQVEHIADDIEFLIRCGYHASIESLRALAGILVGANSAMIDALSRRLNPLLQDKDGILRCRSLLFLASARFPGSVGRIAPSLIAQDENVREAAATALGELRDAAAIPMLVQAYLNNPGSQVFQPAAAAIRMIGGPRASEALVALLSNRSLYRNLRWPAADELGRLGDPSAIGPLITALGDPADVVREHAAGALGLLSANSALDDLHRCLSDPEVGVRIRAAKALGLLQNQESTSYLLGALGDAHPVVREEAALALVRVDQDALLASLRNTVADASSSWRGYAATLLAEMLGHEALPILQLLCRDPDNEAREGGARGLALIPYDDAKSLLLELINDEAEGVRYRAVEGLARQEHFAAIPNIIDRLQKDGSAMVRMEAARALRGLGGSAAVSSLISVVEFDPMIGPYAALALGDLKDETAIPALAAAWRRQEYDFLREYFVIAIGRIDSATAAAVLRDLFLNEDEKRRVEVAQAFHEMRDVTGVPGMLAGLADSAPAVRILARRSLQSLSYQELAAGIGLGLADPQSIVRLQAVKIAPFYADQNLGQTLASLRNNDADAGVRQQSAVAIERWGRKLACLKGVVN